MSVCDCERDCRDFHKALAERREGEVSSLEKGLQKQVADTSRRNASWGQKELALSADHVSPSAKALVSKLQVMHRQCKPIQSASNSCIEHFTVTVFMIVKSSVMHAMYSARMKTLQQLLHRKVGLHDRILKLCLVASVAARQALQFF